MLLHKNLFLVFVSYCIVCFFIYAKCSLAFKYSMVRFLLVKYVHTHTKKLKTVIPFCLYNSCGLGKPTQ